MQYIYWHRCHIHRHSCRADNRRLEKIKRPLAETSDNGAKKHIAFGEGVYENLLVEDQGRAKRKHDDTMDWPSEPTIILGTPRIRRIHVATLCPPLKRRFIHPGGE